MNGKSMYVDTIWFYNHILPVVRPDMFLISTSTCKCNIVDTNTNIDIELHKVLYFLKFVFDYSQCIYVRDTFSTRNYISNLACSFFNSKILCLESIRLQKSTTL